MKLKLLTFFLMVCSLAFGQDYKSTIAQAEQFYNAKDYAKSTAKYKEAFKIEQKNSNDYYNAGCSAALSGKKDLAFEWLNLAYKNGWTNLQHMKSDTDLKTLHGNKNWDSLIAAIQQEIDKKEVGIDKPLQTELLAIYNDDQTIRQHYMTALKEFGNQSKQADSIAKIMGHKDSINLIKVKDILDKKGWVGPNKVGAQANMTLFLVIQHSDLETQQKYLPMMREAVKDKNAQASALALLEDRVALGEGKKQTYGSQVGYDNKTQKNYVLPLEDPDNVDKRRQEVGLGPIAEYVKTWNIVWNVEEYKKMLLEIEKQQKK
ncbi:DUF6624 domain-containing protein [Flavobacterium microcysteis]|uniref:Tetratricopeptide repeat protein n=1 Tax=Flavobacterium microcysteis TaxID=2596891 RepID=A0A501Q4X2_9FLAO|nr:DUF6624 domain-containing protein [Flavobacterium microcysteis]TPD67267.1 hypothetical protein FJA49_13410 [Flavobacterium microcysteis]